METPFGVIHSTNITPDVETGIGAWSYPSTRDAGITGLPTLSAFPYPHFAR
jgi:nicotinate dehydrogenase subunit B